MGSRSVLWLGRIRSRLRVRRGMRGQFERHRRRRRTRRGRDRGGRRARDRRVRTRRAGRRDRQRRRRVAHADRLWRPEEEPREAAWGWAAGARRRATAAAATARAVRATTPRAPRTTRACSTNGNCCSQSCVGGTCAPLNTACKTLGNQCATSAECCSSLCSNGTCQASSFCGQGGRRVLDRGGLLHGDVHRRRRRSPRHVRRDPAEWPRQLRCRRRPALRGHRRGRRHRPQRNADCPRAADRAAAARARPGDRPASLVCQPASGCHVVGDLCTDRLRLLRLGGPAGRLGQSRSRASSRRRRLSASAATRWAASPTATCASSRRCRATRRATAAPATARPRTPASRTTWASRAARGPSASPQAARAPRARTAAAGCRACRTPSPAARRRSCAPAPGASRPAARAPNNADCCAGTSCVVAVGQHPRRLRSVRWDRRGRWRSEQRR